MTDSSIRVYGELLGSEDRTLRYKLLPFGSKGRTNVGLVTASANSVEIPEDLSHLTLNVEHNQMQPVGRFVSIETKEDGLYASVTISKFKRGDDVLNLTASKELQGISVEIAGAVISKGEIVGGELVGAAVCRTPAFSEALLLTASDFGDVEGALEALTEAVEGVKVALAQTDETTKEVVTDEQETQTDSIPVEDGEELEQKGLTAMDNSAIPTALTASNGGSAKVETFEQATALIASASKNRDSVLMSALHDAGVVGEQNLFAALDPVVGGTTGPGENAHAPTWLGHAWEGKAFQRRYTTLLNNAPLTGYKMTAWRFLDKPVVGPYAGFPAQIPTGPVTTQQFEFEAERWAGGNDLDLKYRHFGDQEFLQAYYAAQIEAYARVTDARAIAHLTTEASTTEAGSVPSGVAPAAAHILDGALAMIDVATPTAAIIPASMFRELALTKEQNVLAYLTTSLSLEGGQLAGFQFIPSKDVTEVHVIAKEACTFYELSGSPVRAEVDNPSIGGYTTALFGYTAFNSDSRGIVRVAAAPAA